MIWEHRDFALYSSPFQPMGPTTIVNAIAAVASAIAAVASVVVAVRIGRRAELLAETERQRAERQAAEDAARAEGIAASQRSHESFNTVAQWRRDLRNWAAEAIDVLSEATYLYGDPLVDDERVFWCRHRISALIDRGKFFLPNIRSDELGTDKPYAYRGFRHSGLDPLVAAERVLSTGVTGRFVDSKHALIAMKREFVSSIQRILDPARQNQELERMIRTGHAAVSDDRHPVSPLTDTETLPLGADALLWNPPSYHIGLRREGDSASSDGPPSTPSQRS